MVTRVIKRDGRKAVFSERRIREAVSGAMHAANESTYGAINNIVDACVSAVTIKFDDEKTPSVEEIQNIIVDILKEMKLNNVAKCFSEYREERTRTRESKSDVMKAIARIGEETERDNANVGNNFSAKLLQIASVANKWSNLAKMPKDQSKAHENGDVHIHDLDSLNLAVNCLNIKTGEVLERGFNTGYGYIRPPKDVVSAGALSCILLQSTQNRVYCSLVQ